MIHSSHPKTFLVICCLVIMIGGLSKESSASHVLATTSTYSLESVFPPPLTEATSQTRRAGAYELPVRPEQLAPEPFVFKVPKVQREILPNGIRFYSYQASHILGFYAVALIEAGTLADSPNTVGLAELTAAALRSGGAANDDPDVFDKKLDELGATVSVDIQRDFVKATLFVLPENAPAALELFSAMLMAPRFNEEAVAREKNLLIERILREADDPMQLARREFRKVIYGTTHPLGRSPSIHTIKTLTSADIRRFFSSWYRPDTTYLGIAAADVVGGRQQLATCVGSWKAQGPRPIYDRGSVPSDQRPAFAGAYLLEKDIEQVILRIGHVGRPRYPSEQPAVDVFNNIFGTGGLTSRLMQEIRTGHGLAYGVGGGIFEDNPAGIFVAVGSTKVASADLALKLMLKVTSETLTLAPTPEELETAKRDAQFAFANRFSQPSEVLLQYMLNDLYQYPEDYLEKYPDKVAAVTAEQVLEVAQRYIHPERLSVFLLGRAAVAEKLAKTFSKVKPWPIESQPKPGETLEHGGSAKARR